MRHVDKSKARACREHCTKFLARFNKGTQRVWYLDAHSNKGLKKSGIQTPIQIRFLKSPFVQPWWLGSLGRYHTFSCENAFQRSVDRIQAWYWLNLLVLINKGFKKSSIQVPIQKP